MYHFSFDNNRFNAERSEISAESKSKTKEMLKADNKAKLFFGLGTIVSIAMSVIVIACAFNDKIPSNTFVYLLIFIACLIVGVLSFFPYLGYKEKVTGANAKTNSVNYKEAMSFQTELEYHIRSNGFSISKWAFGPNGTDVLALDSKNHKWLLGTLTEKSCDYRIYSYDQLVKYEVIRNGQKIVSSNSGKALVGGLLFGATGAIVGATGQKEVTQTVSSIYINITDSDAVIHTIPIFGECLKNKPTVKYVKSSEKSFNTKEFISILDVIKFSDVPVAKPVNNAPKSDADEILKFKNLLDSGIITQEEFDAKKKQLLGL